MGTKKKSSRKKVIIVLIILLTIIVLICGTIAIVVNNKIKSFSKLPDLEELTLNNIATSEETNCSINVNWNQETCDISNDIYGLAWADWIDVLPPKELINMLGVSIVRFGGNDFSRFNVKNDTFYKKNGISKLSTSIGDNMSWFMENGTDIILQINMLGYAKDPVTNEIIEISSPESAIEYIKNFENTYKLKIKCVCMDNEPLIWSKTHSDIHPNATTYDEYCNKFIDYASVIKKFDSSIVIMGPESCNPYYYYKSDAPEDKSKGEWLKYFLGVCSTYEDENGIRILDVLTVHRYPIFRSFNSNMITSSNQNILDSIRAWWDIDYQYSGDPTVYGNNGTITTLKRLIEEVYPGTKLGITEYNLDFDQNISYDAGVRALWLADTLGIFASQGIDYAVYWDIQDSNSIGLISSAGLKLNECTYGEKNKVFYSFYLMSKYMRGISVSTESDNKNIRVYASIQDDSKNIIIINGNCDSDEVCTLHTGCDDIDNTYLIKSMSITVISIKEGRNYVYRYKV